jgi:thymidine phosphorylase
VAAPEIIRHKRDGHRLTRGQIEEFVAGLATLEGPGDWADAQVGAMAMAILLRGMDADETVALTAAMTHSGERLHWPDAPGPVLDKHSSGGVGDKVSLMLAPMVASCGGFVPMISGRGLGHTGGTLDKLEALPGYTVVPDEAVLRATLKDCGCAIVGASRRLAPADRRLYAIRDVTATVESVPLITASILSKKLAAGLQGLVLDVKVGSGAFTQNLARARPLAESLVRVARGAGLPATALITDMNQVLGHSAGNALEVQEALDFLTGRHREPRLLVVTLALGAELLCSGGLCVDTAQAHARLMQALDSGDAAARFARMVARLGGPADVLSDAHLPAAPVMLDVPAASAGLLQSCDTRQLGLAVVALGGGRERPDQQVDPRVGIDRVLPLGTAVAVGDPLARVHAADAEAAAVAVAAVRSSFVIGDADRVAMPLVVQRVGAQG